MPLTPEEQLFEHALGLPESQRASFLDAACADNPRLRAAVEQLLAAHHSDDARLDTPVLDAQSARSVSVLLATNATLPSRHAPGDVIDRYKLLEQIGEGGCGVVFMAEQREPVRRRVALKVLKPGMDTKAVIGRFEAERQALALMDHPNIARVFDAGTTAGGHPYFVMELVRGTPITEFCDQENLSTPQRLELLIQVCGAVQHAHQKGIIHRDLKPSNVLVAILDGQPVPKVIDFGIAKATQGPLTDQTVFTAFTQFVGTPAYMSPEQAGLGVIDIDTRADVYSLGVLLYELLTGSPPFDPQDLLKAGFDTMRQRLREEQPQRPSKRLSTLIGHQLETTARTRATAPPRLVRLIQGDLDWIVMKCLEKDRNRRYSTANGLAADLRRHLDMEPVSARPPSKFYLCQRTLRRHKVAFTAAAAVLITLLLGAILAFSQALRAERARAEAAAALERAQKESLRGAQLFEMNDQWRRILYALTRDIDNVWFSNLVIATTTDYLDDAGTTNLIARAHWKRNFGMMHAWMGDMPGAERFMKEALQELQAASAEQGSDLRFARMWLSDFLASHLGRFDDADPLLRSNLAEAHNAVPPDWRTIVQSERNLGFVEMSRSNFPAMHAHFDRALEALPRAFPMQSFGRSYERVLMAGRLVQCGFAQRALHLLQDRLAEEIEFGESLDGQPSDMTRSSIIRLLIQTGQYDAARDWIDDGLSQASGLPPVACAGPLAHRCEVELRQGRLKEALDDALSAFEVNRDNWRAACLLLIKAGRIAEAQPILREAGYQALLAPAFRFRASIAAILAAASTDPQLLEMALIVAKREAHGTSGHYSLATQARIAFRQGRFADAAALAREVPDTALDEPDPLPRTHTGWTRAVRFTEAMAEWQLGHLAEARTTLQRALSLWNRHRSDPTRFFHREWLDGEILHDEALRLITP